MYQHTFYSSCVNASLQYNIVHVPVMSAVLHFAMLSTAQLTQYSQSLNSKSQCATVQIVSMAVSVSCMLTRARNQQQVQ